MLEFFKCSSLFLRWALWGLKKSLRLAFAFSASFVNPEEHQKE